MTNSLSNFHTASHSYGCANSRATAPARLNNQRDIESGYLDRNVSSNQSSVSDLSSLNDCIPSEVEIDFASPTTFKEELHAQTSRRRPASMTSRLFQGTVCHRVKKISKETASSLPTNQALNTQFNLREPQYRTDGLDSRVSRVQLPNAEPDTSSSSPWEQDLSLVCRQMSERPSADEIEAIKTLCKTFATHDGYLRNIYRGFPLIRGISGSLAQPEQQGLPDVPEEVLSKFLLDSQQIRDVLTSNGFNLTRELVNAVLIRAAKTSIIEGSDIKHVRGRVIAATTILEQFCRQEIGNAKYNLADFDKQLDKFRHLADDRLARNTIRDAKIGGVLCGMMIAATYRYAAKKDKTKQLIRSLTDFSVCCLWAWSFQNLKLSYLAAVLVSSYALYELIVPKIKHTFDADQLRLNILHEVLTRTDSLASDAKNGVEFAVKAHNIV